MSVTFSCSILPRSGTMSAVRKLPAEDNKLNPVERRASGNATDDIKKSKISKPKKTKAKNR